MTHPIPKRNMVPKAFLMKSGLVSVNTARQVNIAHTKTTVNGASPMSNLSKIAHSTVKRPINKNTAFKNSNQRVNTVRGNNVNTARPKAVVNAVKGNHVNAVKASACWVWKPKTKVLDHGNPQQDLQEKGVIDSGCSRHMIGNMSYLTDFEEINEGYVAFGGNPKGGKITGRGTIKTGNLDFENVYFVRELKFNLFSVSQMCDKKNSVLFNDTECIVLSPNFKLTDESHVLLKVPRKNNMYSVDLKNIVPKGGLTCLFAKATSDESKLWHRRLGHINFKTMNKLVKGNLVRGLPSKLFENNQTCVACQKGKQHRASCKSKTVSSISQPLHMLHMDLFGPTFVKSLMKKMYCLVVTDDYSRFSWVFFLATKDETSGILKSFITGVENLIDQRVKVIRCDNGTEFKNKEMNQFCERKGIKREFSVARTPQQNGVAERKNRTLIEAARTMLADSKLPTTFWAEAVNTACYVQNRVLVTKPHNKTPYELFLGRKPALGFMRPFGCPVTILNTIDHLGKFDGKADEGFFVGYSINSKAFRVFNSRTRIVEENLHVQFSENTPNIAGSGPNWLFDIDALTKSMNYKPVVAGNQSNGNAGTKACDDAGKARMETVPGKDYILLPFTNNVNAASTNEVIAVGGKTSIEILDNLNMPALEDYSIFDLLSDDQDNDAEADMNNLNTTIQFSPIPTIRIHKYHPIEQIIGDLNSTPQTRIMTKNLEEYGFVVKIEEEVYVCQPPGLEDPDVPDKVYKIEKALYVLHQAPRAWYKTLSTYLLDNGFQRGKIDKTLFIRRDKEVKTASTPMETQKLLLKDEDGEEVDVHMYRSMIGSLMYLTFLRPDIMFAVCACARYQVNLKVSHLHVVKRIFRYLKGQPKLGLWYPKDSPFDLVAYTDSDYARASLDRKSTTGAYTDGNEFSSNIASAIICLATSQKFNFSKLIFESMVKNLDNVGKILMYPRFIQVFLDKQLEGMSNHKRIYIAPSHTKKIFGNIRRVGKGFSGRVTPLFPTMMVQAQQEQGEGSTMPTDPQHTPTITQPSTSQPKKTQTSRKPKKNTKVPQPSGSTNNATDEAVYKELDDSLVRAATIASSLETEKDSGGPSRQDTMGDTIAQTRFKNVSKTSNDSLLAGVNTPRSSLGDQRIHPNRGGKLMALIKMQRLHWLMKLSGEINVAEKEVSTVDPVTTVSEVVTTASVEISTTSLTETINSDDLTLAQTLIEIKSAKPKVKGVVIGEQSESTTRIRPQLLPSKDKDVDYQMAQQMQAGEQEKLSIEEKPKLFVQLLEARKKHFAVIRAQAKRNKPPTKDQKRKTMSTYLKNMPGYKHNQLKNKSFDDIQNLFDKAMKRLEQESSKKQKLEEDKESEELKKCLEIVPDDGDDVTIDATPLTVKSPSIVDWKIHKEGKKSYY
ncbi:putative ribonuclease H-like domain-containing protein [Tanacetum coccineum]